MRPWRFLLGACLLSATAFGCQQRWPSDADTKDEKARLDARASESAAIDARVVSALMAAKARLEPGLDAPVDHERTRCPDETLRSGAASTVIVRTRDSRRERRSPLPLRLVTSLESDEFSAVLTHLSGGAAALWEPAQAKPVSPEAASAVLEELRALGERPYLAELHVEGYADPRLFRRKDAPRSEWAAGYVSGRLVVFDLDAKRPICHAPVYARGDATGAPIRTRLRETTRERLRKELQDKAWSAMEAAMASISSRLHLPPSTRRNDAAQRWAAARDEKKTGS